MGGWAIGCSRGSRPRWPTPSVRRVCCFEENVGFAACLIGYVAGGNMCQGTSLLTLTQYFLESNTHGCLLGAVLFLPVLLLCD